MFKNQHLERVRKLFADQFQPDGDAFVYRKNMKGVPIHVSEAERDAFVFAFNRRSLYWMWSIFPATLLLIGGLVAFGPDANGPYAHIAIFVGLAVILTPMMVGYYWAFKAPARELAQRPALGEALTADEVRKLRFSKMTYQNLGFAVLGSLGLLWKVSTRTDVLHGWGTLWLVFTAAIISVAGVQAFRKWRFERK